MNKILIAYDGSSCAKAALEDLPRAGLPEELEGRVLSVAEVWLPPEAVPPAMEAAVGLPVAVQRAREAAWHAVEEDSRHLAEGAARRLQVLFPKWHIKAVAVGDSPALGIVSQAAEWGANLIVVGSHGRSLMERFFLGSVSHKVALEASCSVHIARPRPGAQTHRLLLAVDGSMGSLAAVRAVADRAWPPAAAFQIVTLLDSRLLTTLAWPSSRTEPWTRPTDTTGTEWLERVQTAAAHQLRAAGLTVETRLLEAEGKHALLKHAEDWQADCLFLGAHGLHHGPRRLLGSFSSAVATRAHCSVEIVREKAPAQQGSAASSQPESSS